MEWEFADEELTRLYTTGTSRKLRLPQGIPRLFVMHVGSIDAAKDINDLRNPPSMKFKKLEGKQNQFSIRLNKQFRLIFALDFDDLTRLTGKVLIQEINKHYE